MSKYLNALFEDKQLVEKIKSRLPYLFHMAELESSRAGNTGMEVGSAREKILIALLIYKFGDPNVEVKPITEPEIDVKLFGQPISIKTITSKYFSGVKLSWTVDPLKVKEFLNNYRPYCDILYVQINWDSMGGFYYIPVEIQKELLNKIGGEKYIKPPKPGTNPRGPEITKEALSSLVQNNETKSILIKWHKTKIDFNPYKRWIDLWEEE